jgi:hypothetical protein
MKHQALPVLEGTKYAANACKEIVVFVASHPPCRVVEVREIVHTFSPPLLKTL